MKTKYRAQQDTILFRMWQIFNEVQARFSLKPLKAFLCYQLHFLNF
jgi:hypothetical protein